MKPQQQSINAGSFFLFLTCLFLTVIHLDARAMGFRVQPSALSFEIAPARTAVTTINIRNIQLDDPLDLVIEPLDIMQLNNGSFQFVSGDNNQIKQSCIPWIQLEQKSLTIAPGAAQEVEFRFRVPQDATGDHFGVIGIRAIPRNTAGQVTLSTRLAVMVEISVTGRTARRNVEVKEIDLTYRQTSERASAREGVTIAVSNTGELTATVSGQISIFSLLTERARRVMTIPVDEVKVLPGMSFDIVKPTPRRLPSGQYRLVSEMMIDGRRIGSRTVETDFQGDPSIVSLEADALISLEPAVLTVQGTPRARRRVVAQLKNEGDDPVQIQAVIAPVQQLSSVTMGEIAGELLQCHDWTTVEPSSFTLAPGASRRLAIQTAFPEEGVLRPSSYANLVVNASFEDGQQAASLSGMIIAHNTRSQPVRKLEVTRAGLSQDAEAGYSLAIEYVNVGETDLDVGWTASVTDASRTRVFQTVEFSKIGTPLLPLGTNRVHAPFKISSLETGSYLLVLEATFAEERHSRRYSLRISERDGEKRPEMNPLSD